MTFRRIALTSSLGWCALLLHQPAWAEPKSPPPPPPPPCSGSLGGCFGAAGSGNNFGVGATGGTDSDTGHPARPSTGGAPVVLSENVTRHQYILACQGNTVANGGDLNCNAARAICSGDGPGYLAYWLYEATFVRATGDIVAPGWQRLDTRCLPPGSPALDPRAAIPGLVERDFQSLVVVKGVAVSQPHGTTLVNYETGYYTEAGRYTLAPVGILGHTVVITATPARYDWTFGDGTQALNAGPGTKDTTDVSHTYKHTGSVAPYVVITWTGTFTVDGGRPQPVIGTATTTGPGTALQIKQARSELVAG